MGLHTYLIALGNSVKHFIRLDREEFKLEDFQEFLAEGNIKIPITADELVNLAKK